MDIEAKVESIAAPPTEEDRTTADPGPVRRPVVPIAAPVIETAEGDTLFGRYRLRQRIGKGGMAEVFLATMEGARGFRRRCVVKRIRPDKAKSNYFVQMFTDEARITAALHHPNIVQVYDYGEIDNLCYLTMEYLDGATLGATLDSFHEREQSMPLEVAAHVAQQIARGLHYAHTLTDHDGIPLGVIHRDISPSNVMLLRSGEVKILDFGVAQAESALKQGATVVGRVKGKLAYMAPEQHAASQMDARADVFSIGVLLWEMLTGDYLFSGERAADHSRELTHGTVQAPSVLRADVPAVLDAIVLRCLQLNPEDRFSSAEALAAALGDYVRQAMFDPDTLAKVVSEVAITSEDSASGSASASGRPEPPPPVELIDPREFANRDEVMEEANTSVTPSPFLRRDMDRLASVEIVTSNTKPMRPKRRLLEGRVWAVAALGMIIAGVAAFAFRGPLVQLVAGAPPVEVLPQRAPPVAVQPLAKDDEAPSKPQAEEPEEKHEIAEAVDVAAIAPPAPAAPVAAIPPAPAVPTAPSPSTAQAERPRATAKPPKRRASGSKAAATKASPARSAPLPDHLVDPF